MSSEVSAAQLLATVQASPTAVAAHDRAGWVGLFAVDGQVNDPVGSRPHEGRAAIERFYDTFIAPNTIVFHVEHDVVCGSSVMRDLTIETRMSTGAVLQVPMHLRYDLVDENGALKIRRLYAHWELPAMIRQLLRQGAKGLGTSATLGAQMLRHQGLGGALGFAQGFSGVGEAGKRQADAFLAAISQRDLDAAGRALAKKAALHWPYGTAVSLRQFANKACGLRWRKLLAAGRYVTATLTTADESRRGVALVHFDADVRISSVQIFVC